MSKWVEQRIRDGIAGIYRRAHEQHGGMTPCVEVYVDDEFVTNISQSGSVASILQDVTVEDSVEQTSSIRLTVLDDEMFHIDNNTFAKGRTLSVWAGYDDSMLELLRAIIVRADPRFEEDGSVVLSITAYDISYKLAVEEVEAQDENSRRGKARESGVSHSGTWAEIVSRVYGKYGVRVFASKSFMEGRPSYPVIQKKGTTDAQFLQSVANILGAELFVTWRMMDEDGSYLQTGRLYRLKEKGLPIPATRGQWVCYMREQPKKPEGPMYQWMWRAGNETSLLSFFPEPSPLSDVTSIQVLFYDTKAKDWVVLGKDDDPAPSGYTWRKEKRLVKNWIAKDIRSSRLRVPGADPNDRSPLTDEEIALRENMPFSEQLHHGAFEGKDGERERVVRKKVKVSARRGLFADAAARGDLTNTIRIVAGNTSIDVKAKRNFRTAAQAIAYAEAFIRNHRDSYWTASAELIMGLETVRAGQLHLFSGLGNSYSGLYYLSNVTHRIDASGYTTSMTVRRVVDEIPLLEE